MLEAFHFLRPLWLLALVPTVVLYAAIRASSPERQWRQVIAPHLLEHLTVGGDGSFRFRPLHLVTLLLALGSIALAGPTWERERSPFAEDTAPLVIALDLSPSMNAIDVQPSRLEAGQAEDPRYSGTSERLSYRARRLCRLCPCRPAAVRRCFDFRDVFELASDGGHAGAGQEALGSAGDSGGHFEP